MLLPADVRLRCTADPSLRLWTVNDTDIYNRKMDVVNRGFSGYNTEWIIPVFEQVRPTHTYTHPSDAYPNVAPLQVFATQHEQQHVPRVRLLVIRVLREIGWRGRLC